MLKVIRYLTSLSAVLAALLIGLYLGSAVLISNLTPRFAANFGLDDISIHTGRPGFASIEIESFRAIRGGVEIEAFSGALTYDLVELLNGEFQSLKFSTLTVTVNNSATPEPIGSNTLNEDTTILPAEVFALIPFAEVTIDELTLSVPRLQFLGAGSLHLANGELLFQMNGRQPVQAEHFRIEGEVHDAGSILVRFFDTGIPERPFLIVDSNIDSTDKPVQVSIEVSFDLAGLALQLAADLAGAPPGSGSLQGKIHTDLPWPITTSSLDNVDFQGTFDFTWQDSEDRGSLRDLNGSFTGRRGSHNGDMEGVEGLNTEIEAVIDGGSFELGEASASLAFPSGYPVSYRNGTITLGAGMTFSAGNESLGAQGSLRSLTVQLSKPLIVDLDADLAGNGFDLATAGRAQVHGELAQDGELLTGNIKLSVGDVELAATFRHLFPEGKGRLSSMQEISFATPLFASIFDSWTYPFDVTRGQVAVDLELAWLQDKPIQGKVSLVMSELDGVYDDFVFTGISGVLPVRIIEGRVALTRSQVAIKRTDIGMELTDISVDVAWEDETVTIDDLTMNLLGGSAVVTRITFGPEQKSSTIYVELKALSLAEVLALEGDNISGTGTLNGQLPLRINEGKISMANGQLKAEPPGGNLQLSTDYGDTGQLGLDFALTALTNFNYTSLDVAADYSESGELALAVKLLGSNPEVENGRPIVYNLTISENIPVLLESLRAQQGMIDQIERRLRNTKG